jgi:UDP-perosamine 4-acetyltransferase
VHGMASGAELTPQSACKPHALRHGIAILSVLGSLLSFYLEAGECPELDLPDALRVVVIGAGGHAKVVLEILRAAGGVEVVGLLDPAPHASLVRGVPVLGGDDLLTELRSAGVAAAVVALGNNRRRQQVGGRARELGFALPAIIHPSAIVSPSARLEAGVVVMARVVIGTEAEVEQLAVINSGAVVEHDNRIGKASHIGPACALAGNVRVGDRALVGVGSAVRPGIIIGSDAVVGAGSAVIKDVPEGAMIGGSPARSLV